MNYIEIFWNNIASLALIPIVIAIVLKLKNTQIDSLREQNDSLREQNNILKEQAKLLGLFRVSEVEKEFKALSKFYEKKTREADKARDEWDKTVKELEKVKSLSKAQAEEIVSLFRKALQYMNLVSMSRGITGQGYISSSLWTMKGPIGDLWRQHIEEEQLRWKKAEKEKKQK